MARNNDTLDLRIRSAYDDLPSRERDLADLLLEFPGDVAIYSATDLAKRASVSNAAVTRLIKRLGYGDYREAQSGVRAQQSTGQPLYLNNSLVQPPTQSSDPRPLGWSSSISEASGAASSSTDQECGAGWWGARARTVAKEMGDEAGGWRASDSGQPITDCALHGNVAWSYCRSLRPR